MLSETLKNEIFRLSKVVISLNKTIEMSSCMFTKELLHMEVQEIARCISSLREEYSKLKDND